MGGGHNLPERGPGVLYLVAVMDWRSRYVLAWRLSNPPDQGWRQALEAGFCAEAWRRPWAMANRGVQHRPRKPVHQPGVHPDPHGARGEEQHGREGAIPDNIFVERLWRAVK